MTAIVCRIEAVEKHPKADRLDIYTVNGNKCISSRRAEIDGFVPRYNVGDMVVYIPVNNKVSHNLLKNGFWDTEKNRPILGGEDGDIVVPITLRGVESSGIMFPIVVGPSTHSWWLSVEGILIHSEYDNNYIYCEKDEFNYLIGTDVSERLGVVEIV